MSGSQLALLGGPFGPPPAYQIQRSLRFNSADSSDLSRTPASASNRKTFTVSVWLKRSSLVSRQGILTVPVTGSLYWGLEFDSSSSIIIYDSNAGGGTDITTSAVYRDFSAWYHIVVAVDTTQATASNRVKLYVNGTQVTAFSSANYPTQNSDTYINSTSTHRIGSWVSVSTLYFNGYMTEFYLIDGQALTPSSFGETNANTGVWQPKQYTGTYGTNGFYLNFSDNSGTTSTTLGKDYSGNGNNWTPNNFSVTAGTGNDSLVDTPTPYGTDTGAGGEVRGNYNTLNPLTTTAGTYTQGNLRYEGASGWRRSSGTIPVTTGKWYWEVTLGSSPYTPRASTTAYNAMGFCLASTFNSTTSFSTQTDALLLGDNGYYKNFTNSPVDAGAFSSGDVLAVAVDLDANTFTFYRNNSSVGTGTIGGTAGRELTPCVLSYDGVYGVMDCNFGQRPFAYTAPSGFKALCTQNLPTPTIGATSTTQAGKYFNTVLYTGTGASLGVTGAGFQPDFVWIKSRSEARSHALFDVLRGATIRLYSDSTVGDQTETTTLTAFNTDGFTVSTSVAVNNSAQTYASWNWKAGGAGVTNTQGSITSTVSANTTAGFSVVTYTGNGSAGATVGHGLGATPGMIIIKCRNNPYNWAVWQTSLGGGNNALQLNTTGATTTAFNYWNSTNPGSSVFTLGNDNGVNQSSATYVAYCFAPVAGYSVFGSYTGNGSSNGPFIYTGFRPAYILVKSSSGSTTDWVILDTKRSTFNVSDAFLAANLSDAEQTDQYVRTDILSNGFKARSPGSFGLNINNTTYIYAAFAENPFKYALAR